MVTRQRIRLFDIAANLSDQVYEGLYHSKRSHPPDLEHVISRAESVGVTHFLLAGGNLEDSAKALQVSQSNPNLYATVGVHPCRANTVSGNDYFDKLYELIQQNPSKTKAIGECGLDYDRLNYSSREEQLAAFPKHFDLAERTGLPMYLHNRNTGNDFFDMVRQNRDRFVGGVVHSFTGDQNELDQILELGLYVGVNGCSLKTEQNCEAVRNIPLDRMMLETDCPYCEIRKSHAGSRYVKTQFTQQKKERYQEQYMVRGRNEPCTIVQVLEVVAALLGVEEEELARVTYENSMNLFNINIDQAYIISNQYKLLINKSSQQLQNRNFLKSSTHPQQPQKLPTLPYIYYKISQLKTYQIKWQTQINTQQ